MKASYAKAEVNVDKIVRALENHQVVLMKDIAMLDQMYELNTKYYKELTMYIIAGKKRLEYLRTHDLEDLKQKAAKSGSQEDAQAYNDFANLCSRFEQEDPRPGAHRMISVQMGPPDPSAPEQRHPDAGEDPVLPGEHHSLWKSQMVLALGLEHSRQATAAQSAVTEMTNQLLQKNADMLKIGTVETAGRPSAPLWTSRPSSTPTSSSSPPWTR